MTGETSTVSERYQWDKPVSHTFINPDSIFIHGSGADRGLCNLLRCYGELLLNGNTPRVGLHFWGDCSLHQLWLEIKIAYVPGYRLKIDPAFDPGFLYEQIIPEEI
jgi:hypothetical protein